MRVTLTAIPGEIFVSIDGLPVEIMKIIMELTGPGLHAVSYFRQKLTFQTWGFDAAHRIPRTLHVCHQWRWENSEITHWVHRSLVQLPHSHLYGIPETMRWL